MRGDSDIPESLPVNDVIDSPFATRWQAYGFAALLVTILILPFILSRLELSRRQDVYRRIPERFGAFSYIVHEIFDESSDIDILFIGSSALWSAIDVPYVQGELGQALGRPANVIMFGSNWRGEELNYTLLREVIERRKVRLLVITMPYAGQSPNVPHPQSFRWLPYERNDFLRGLPLASRIAIYGEQALGAPRHLLGIVRSDIHENTDSSEVLRLLNGFNRVADGFRGAPFVRQRLRVPVTTPGSMIYSPESQHLFAFTYEPLSEYQMHFLRHMMELAKRVGLPVAILNVPLFYQYRNTFVEERMPWSDVFGLPLPIIGVPPAKLFQGMSEAEIKQYFYDQHMNMNGSELLTRTVTPAVVAVYQQHARSSY